MRAKDKHRPNISVVAMQALYKMGEKAPPPQHNKPVKVRSMFTECPCLTCIDGGIDMPHCSECNPSNGFAYFRKKV